MRLKPKISVIIIISSLLLMSSVSFAQKKKREKKGENKELTKYEIANAEYLLIEAQKFFILEDYQKSKAFLNQSLEVDTKNHAAYFKLAEIAFILTETDNGLEAITNAISIVADNKYYYLLAAQLHKQKNDLPSAAIAYEQMIEFTEDYHDYLLDLVDVYVELNQFKKAITTMDMLIDKYGENTKFTLQKAYLLLSSEDSNGALKLIKDLIDSGTNDKDLILEYAGLVSNFHSVQEAIDFLESRNSSVETDMMLMQLYSGINQYEKVDEIILNAIVNPTFELDGKLNMAYELLNQPNISKNESLLISLLSKLKEQYQENTQVIEFTGQLYWELSKINRGSKEDFLAIAIESFIKMRDVDPSNFQTWNRILQIEYDSKNWVDLFDHSNEALDLFPNQGLFYFYNGTAAFKAGDINNATSSFRQGLRLSTNNSEVTSRILAMQAQILFNQGKIEPGIEHFENALNLENSHPEVLNSYSLELALRKINLDHAIEISQHLISLNRSSAEYLYTRSFVLFQAEQFAGAERLLGSILNEDGIQADGKILEIYGDILFKMNKPNEALVEWQKAKNIGGVSDKLEQKIATKEYYE